MNRHEYLQQWREGLQLPLSLVARTAHMADERLRELEQGRSPPSIGELEALARVLGFDADDLLDETVPALQPAGADPLRMLLKSAEAFHPAPEVRLRMIDAAQAALTLLELKQAQQERPVKPFFEQFTSQPFGSDSLHEQGNRLAKVVRKQLQLGSGPILSMRDLVAETLDIPLLLADLTLDGPDAFTVYAPSRRAAMVLNAVGKNTNALVRRFSIAHELCHALFDRPSGGPLGIACWQDAETKLDQEIRANAFAIRLLVPEHVVTRKGEELFRPRVLRHLMEEYGVHLRALQLYIKNLLGLSEQEVKQLPKVETTPPLVIRDSEELAAERGPLFGIPLSRRGELALTAARACSAGQISLSHLRDILRVDATVDTEGLFSFLDVPMPERGE